MVSSQALREDQELRPEVYRSVPPSSSSELTDADLKQGNKYKSDVNSQFQPWPSIDEVKARRDQLLKRSPLAFGKSIPHTTIPASTDIPSNSSSNSSHSNNNNRPGPSNIQRDSRPPIPQHRKFEHETCSPPEQTNSDDRRSSSPTRRFRISVSPTRRVMAEDLDRASPSKRVYIIKQESAAPSSSSLQEKKPSPRAPRVEFGDDDSPRVQN